MIDEDFFKRTATEVAEDLVARIVVEYDGINNIMLHGILTEVGAFDKPLEDRGEELYVQEPGKLGVFSSRRGPISIITSHVEGGSGLVTLRYIKKYDADLQTTDIAELSGLSGQTRLYVGQGNLQTKDITKFLNFAEKTGLYVGRNSHLYIGEKPFDLAAEGLVVSSVMPSGGPPNRVAYFTLKSA
jgi:hypothetical protein|tara:strand:- start:432 stop:989 length:558 start_codon:yes stop_codon:yes gene_type:complete